MKSKIEPEQRRLLEGNRLPTEILRTVNHNSRFSRETGEPQFTRFDGYS